METRIAWSVNYSVSILWTSLQLTLLQSADTSIFHYAVNRRAIRGAPWGALQQVGTGNLVASSGSKGQSGVVSGKATCSPRLSVCFSRESCLLPSCLINQSLRGQQWVLHRVQGTQWQLQPPSLTPLLEEEANIMLLKTVQCSQPLWGTSHPKPVEAKPLHTLLLLA